MIRQPITALVVTKVALPVTFSVALSITQISCHPSGARSASDISSLGVIFDTPTVVHEPETVDAKPISTGALERIVQWRREKLLGCYALDTAASNRPRRHKSIVVNLSIDTHGLVKTRDAAWDLSEEAKICLLQTFNWLHVAPPQAPYEVSYPMHFSPDNRENTPVIGAYTTDTIMGDLGRDHILPQPIVRQMILGNSDALRACYRDARKQDPSLSGDINLRLVIEPNGWASSAGNAGSTLRAQAAINCVARTVLGLPFALSPDTPTSVLFPIVFAPPGSYDTWNSIVDIEDSTPPNEVASAGAPIKIGRLEPEVVQKVVRGNFGVFRRCYEEGLGRNSTLTGRVTIRFVIGLDGLVASVGNGGSDLPDTAAVNCIIRSVSKLRFPPPDDGIVTVTYPISFSPDR